MPNVRKGKRRKFGNVEVHRVTHQHEHMAGSYRFGSGPEVIVSTIEATRGETYYGVYWRVSADTWYLARDPMPEPQFRQWDGQGDRPTEVYHDALIDWLNEVSRGGTGRGREPIG